LVLEARRALGVLHAGDQASALEALQTLGQDVGRDVLGRSKEITEATFAGEQVANDEQSPAIAYDVEGVSHGTQRAQF